ncbi:MAG: BON domain-containing protein [Chloroflexi bacterium]|jgi:osmotically-inducible protein OsmY|nr:BON domain-containing protein [Chloroflexota bacterium]
MEERIKRAVTRALQRNTFTANQAIDIIVQGRVVILAGEVGNEDLIYEAVATAESVHPKLRVYSDLVVNPNVAEV